MATYKKTLQNKNGDVILPRTTVSAVYLEDMTTTIEEAIDDKQDTLVSGTNIKTINSTSILGSGDIAVPLKSTSTGTLVNYIWSGTQAQYDAIGTKDANTLYFIV